MRKLGIETWRQRMFYGFVFVVGFFFQPHWFYMNFYSNPKLRDGATWVPSYEIYQVVSDPSLCASIYIAAGTQYACLQNKY